MKMLFKNPYLWWRFEGRYYHKYLYWGIKNLWKWFPVIWKDRDWDQTHIYKILEFKLEQQAYGIASRDIHVGAQREAEKMLLCARLCRIQIEDLYGVEYLDYIEQAHKFTPTDNGEFYEYESMIMEDNLDEYFAKYKRQHTRVLEGKVTWFGKVTNLTDRKDIAMCIAEENQRRSRKLLFKILDENIEGFWD
jgi:hypothetical protein